jgi:hypothetical protein
LIQKSFTEICMFHFTLKSVKIIRHLTCQISVEICTLRWNLPGTKFLEKIKRTLRIQ